MTLHPKGEVGITKVIPFYPAQNHVVEEHHSLCNNTHDFWLTFRQLPVVLLNPKHYPIILSSLLYKLVIKLIIFSHQNHLVCNLSLSMAIGCIEYYYEQVLSILNQFLHNCNSPLKPLCSFVFVMGLAYSHTPWIHNLYFVLFLSISQV